MENKMQKAREAFLEMWSDVLADREGNKELLDWLEHSGFFTAPASARHHMAYEGVLCEHTVNVANNAVELMMNLYAFRHCTMKAVVVAALLHDICKVGSYEETKDGYKSNGGLCLGHGEGSVIIAQRFIKLTEAETYAIRWHMGAYTGERDWNTASKVFDEYPEALCVHMANMIATHHDEVGK